MTPQEHESLIARARQKRDRDMSALQRDYENVLKAIEVVWSFSNTAGTVEEPQVPGVQAVVELPAPPADTGPIALVRRAVRELPRGYTMRFVLGYITDVFNVPIEKKAVSSALNKLVRRGEIRFIRKGDGQQPGAYETTPRGLGTDLGVGQ